MSGHVAAGYSGTPLAKKLGLAGGQVVAVIDEPDGFRTLLDTNPDGQPGALPADITFKTSLPSEPDQSSADVLIVFAIERAMLEAMIPVAAAAVFPDGAIWAAWPKKAAKVPTDITEDTVRDIALPVGLVDNKVCAIDAVWSGLRVVWRKERRTQPLDRQGLGLS